MILQDLTEAEFSLLSEALHRLRAIKVDAHAEVSMVRGHGGLTLQDFGVPAIDALLEKLDIAVADQQPVSVAT